MKSTFLILTLLNFSFGFAQKKEEYYDYAWKPSSPELASYFSTIEKTDSGWLRHDYYVSTRQLQMKAVYADADCKIQNGSVAYFYSNGNISVLGRRINGKREGLCMSFYSNGMLADSANYESDRVVGVQMRWYRNGYPSDSITYTDDSSSVHIGWFEDGSPESGGRLLFGKRHGKWMYFHRNGTVAGEVVYDKGDVVARKYFNEDGSVQPDTSAANSAATFKSGGIEGWLKYLGKKSIWPTGYELVNTNKVTVVVSFTINEKGEPENIEMAVPFHRAFDDLAMEIIRKSPTWKPAMLHNRKWKSNFRQPLTFQQE